MAANKKKGSLLEKLTGNQIIIPVVALLAIVIVNLIANPRFFEIRIGQSASGYMVLSGNLITLLDNASELVILAIGMTLVTAASGGQDISVGATIAIAGSVMLKLLCGKNGELQTSIALAFAVAAVVTIAFGAFNGVLVAYFKIQPMVATLILFTAGRSIAAWINNNELPVISDPRYGYFGNFIPGIAVPTPVLFAIACMILIFLVLKFTNLGLYTQTVGINARAARLNGLNPEAIKLMAYMILGFCVAVAGFIKTARISSINYSVIAQDIEMDAILAVALGGNALSGGKFNMWASILGAYVIQALTTTLYSFKVPSTALPAYKAVVVIILVVLSAPPVRVKLTAMKRKRAAAGSKEVAGNEA